MMLPSKCLGAVVLWVGLPVTLSSCRQDMHNQPRMRPYRPSAMFSDDSSARLPPSGTVAQNEGPLDTANGLQSGSMDGHLITAFPEPVDAALLARGQERYTIFCSPCHGLTGHGDGAVARRGFFPHVADLQQLRLRQASVGYFFGVISNGFNTMPAYGPQLAVSDRWAIIAYIRALQLSQHADVSDLPEVERQRLKESEP